MICSQARTWAMMLMVFVSFAGSLLAATELPHIVIILVDDMGYGDPKCFNPKSQISTPHIDSLAEQGMRFTDAHAPGPLCHMSRYGLMTGEYPFRIDVKVWPKQPLIQSNQMTIASLAKKKGYHTAMVGKWHLGFKEEGYDKPLKGGPIDCGFDRYFGMRASTDIPPYFYIRGDRAVEQPTAHIKDRNSEGWTNIQGEFVRAGGIAPSLRLEDVLPTFTNEAVQVIQKHKEKEKKPLMLYLAYPAPHTPWLPSKKFQGKSKASLYGDFVMMVDDEIGKVLTALKKAKMFDNTMIILTSDNGPCWYEDDIKRLQHDATGPLRGMKGDAWEGGHRMPFVVCWPQKVEAGATTDQMICFTDLLATFADLWEFPLPKGAGPDSFSFLNVLLGKLSENEIVREFLVMQAGSSSTMTIRSGDWKYINQLGSGGFSKPKVMKPSSGGPEGQLYNLQDDLGEAKNLYMEKPEIVERLKNEMEKIVQSGRSRRVFSK